MRFEITGRGSNHYYDEFLYLVFNYAKYRKNPRKKLCRISLSAYLYSVVSAAMVAIFLILYLLTKKQLFFIIQIGFIGIFILSLVFLTLIKISITKHSMRHIDSTFEITKDYVRVENDQKQVQLNWDDIQFIIVGKYTINFIPKDKNQQFITTRTAFKDDVFKAIKKFNKEDLIIE